MAIGIFTLHASGGEGVLVVDDALSAGANFEAYTSDSSLRVSFARRCYWDIWSVPLFLLLHGIGLSEEARKRKQA